MYMCRNKMKFNVDLIKIGYRIYGQYWLVQAGSGPLVILCLKVAVL